MSQEEIHQDSLLSSISNISVKIDHTQIDDPGFFNQNMHRSVDEHRIDCEVDVEALEDDEDIDPASLVKQIYYRYRGKQVGKEQYDGVQQWVGRREEQGVSEEERGGQFYSQFGDVQQKHQLIKEQRPYSSISLASAPKMSHQSSPIIRHQFQQKGHSFQANLILCQQQQKHPNYQKRLKNQTKNIPKNYGKAIITFIQKYQPQVRSILSHHNIDYQQFTLQLRQKKRVINTIADLRSMWLDYDHAKSMRVLSNLFLRKYALNYIFNSRICNYASHIKYRHRLSDAIKQPGLFKHIKDY